MRKALNVAVVVVLTGVAASAQQPTEKPAVKSSGGNQERIRLAMSAAPPEIGRNATIVDTNEKGEMTELRKGTNGWTCMPSAGGATGAAGADPMCLDPQWTKWADAWMHKTDPKVDAPGIAYMLHGDMGASNTDPFATAQTPDNQWVVSPPHLMVLVPDTKMLDALPTDPHHGGPWVMWKGTKYAHIMVPTAPMPKQPGAAVKSPKQ
jgi:hypothetical protein